MKGSSLRSKEPRDAGAISDDNQQVANPGTEGPLYDIIIVLHLI
jgi:hypothetical protein